MCGRVRLSSDVSEIKLVFGIPPDRPIPNFPPSWNAAPTDSLPVVRFDAKARQRSLDLLRWGLVPYWAKDMNVGFANINAKAEGIETKPAFRKAFERRRCLVPVDNFYEWKKTEGGKQPYAIALADRGIMALAGYGRIGTRRPANGSAPSRSSRPSRTNCAPSSTTACPRC
jgi:putative SOS response-associated peptidase YedK